MKKRKLLYSAGTNTNEGMLFEHFGALEEAIKLAKKYAKEAFPKQPKGYGPKITVDDAETRERIFEGYI